MTDPSNEPYGHTIPGLAPIVTGTGVTYTAWTDGYAVGFRAVHPDGRVEYIYLNPSHDEPEADENPNVFLYTGPAGSTDGDDAPVCYVDLFTPAGPNG